MCAGWFDCAHAHCFVSCLELLIITHHAHASRMRVCRSQQAPIERLPCEAPMRIPSAIFASNSNFPPFPQLDFNNGILESPRHAAHPTGLWGITHHAHASRMRVCRSQQAPMERLPCEAPMRIPSTTFASYSNFPPFPPIGF